jgi:DNA-binding transcriptional LysR family regulator
MDWDKLRIFHAAAEAGSFTHAGESLRMSQSAVSRQVSSLEKDLGIALFHRHARGLVLTEQGDMLYRTASDVMNKLQTAETLLADTTTKPTGELRITCPSASARSG